MTIRLQRFKRFCDITGGSSHDFICEYVNVLTADKHEFQNDATRDRYAELILAMLTFVYGEDRRKEAIHTLALAQAALAALEERAVATAWEETMREMRAGVSAFGSKRVSNGTL